MILAGLSMGTTCWNSSMLKKHVLALRSPQLGLLRKKGKVCSYFITFKNKSSYSKCVLLSIGENALFVRVPDDIG